MSIKEKLKSLLLKTVFLLFFGFFLYFGLLTFDFSVPESDLVSKIISSLSDGSETSSSSSDDSETILSLLNDPVVGIFLLSLAIALLLVADEAQAKRDTGSESESREKTDITTSSSSEAPIKGHTSSEPESGEKTNITTSFLSEAQVESYTSNESKSEKKIIVKKDRSTFQRFLIFCAQRKALVALTFLLTLSSIWLIVSMIPSLLRVEYTDSAGIGIRFGDRGHRKSLDFYPISPHVGWQNTRIRLKKDESFQVEILGRVSPGYVRSLKEIREYIKGIEKWENMPKPEILWRFCGPKGYEDEFYEQARRGETPDLWRLPHYKDDLGLTVKGLPHNTVVGIVLPEGIKPKGVKPEKCVKSEKGIEPEKEKQYDWETDRSSRKPKLILLSPNLDERYPITRQALNSGVLWVVINDAAPFRMDNMGQFFMTVRVK